MIMKLFASKNNSHPVNVDGYLGMDELLELFDGKVRVDLEFMYFIGDEFDFENEVLVLRGIGWFHDLNF